MSGLTRTEQQLSWQPSWVSPSLPSRRWPSGVTTPPHSSQMPARPHAMVARSQWTSPGWRLSLYQLFRREVPLLLPPGSWAVPCQLQRYNSCKSSYPVHFPFDTKIQAQSEFWIRLLMIAFLPLGCLWPHEVLVQQHSSWWLGQYGSVLWWQLRHSSGSHV